MSLGNVFFKVIIARCLILLVEVIVQVSLQSYQNVVKCFTNLPLACKKEYLLDSKVVIAFRSQLKNNISDKFMVKEYKQSKLQNSRLLFFIIISVTQKLFILLVATLTRRFFLDVLNFISLKCIINRVYIVIYRKHWYLFWKRELITCSFF